ncbi:MAG: tetratricopeptide repeat protein, partial [Acidobacteria bacterium]|nr:tetratricopeptide repeat protein [Acidobacteriota bacterium]
MKARPFRMLYCFLLLSLGAGAVSDGRPQSPKESARERKAASGALDKTVARIRTLIEEERYAEAETEGRAALVEVEERHGPDSLEIAGILYVLVDALQRGGKARDTRDRQTLEWAERVVSIRERVLGPDHEDFGAALYLLGRVLHARDDYEKARACFERSLAISEKVFGPGSRRVAVELEHLGATLRYLGEFARAKPVLERALAIHEKNQGPEHLDVAAPAQALAGVLSHVGELAEARVLCERALRIQEKELRPDHPRVASTLNNLATIALRMGDYESAEPLFQRTLAIKEKAGDDVATASTVDNYGILLWELGALGEAVRMFERAVSLFEKTLGPRSSELAGTLGNLGAPLLVAGDYSRARQVMERALDILEQKFGPDHIQVGWLAGSLAALHYELGDRAAARSLFRRAIVVVNKAAGPEHFLALDAQSNLADLDEEEGKYSEALEVYEQVLAIREKTLGPKHPSVAESLERVAGVTAHVGNYVDARAIYERAIAIREAAIGPEDPGLAKTRRSLAVLLVNMGNPVEAQPMFDRAIGIQERVLGAHHPELATSLLERARALVRVGDWMGAFRDALRAEEIAREHVRLTARAIAEREALRYAAVRASGLSLALSLAAGAEPEATTASGGQGPDVEPLAALASQSLDALIRSRALVLDEMGERHRTVAGTADPEVKRLEAELASARQRLASLTVRGADEKDLARWRARVERARQDKEVLERALADKSLPFRQEQARRRLGLEAVAAALSPGEALLSFTRYDRYDTSAGSALPRAAADPVPAYLAFVLRSGDGEARDVPLGPAREIDRLVSELRNRMTEEARAPGRSARRALGAYRRVGEALREKVWDPVAPHLKGVRRVFVVPDGVLNLVNLSALPAGGSAYLLEREPLIHYLSTERDLVPSEAQGRGEGLLALGAPAFDDTGLFAAMSPRSAPAGSPAGEVPTASATVASLQVFRGARSACGDFKSMRFEPLPEAGRELDEITKLWDERVRGGGTGGSRAAGAAPDVARRSGPD